MSIEAEYPKLMLEARRAGGGVGEGWQGYVGERSGMQKSARRENLRCRYHLRGMDTCRSSASEGGRWGR